ncbi:MarR family transcriptional regulator [Phaeobacter gallaeciensis]|uniref:Transcriptional regulator n=1 Tax=Phaeobacter gallaeciensis TaxID=60890 RepID=A0AAC9ZCH7_9RHOB|nr:MarR family transcriptional regulator [Phaeobacter gallaeciensis]AHD11577.1 Transcriptional regulator [Phaeobacter gallaeciensis DSM 26640]ATE94841.1 Transcriptional regulator [Phaeobacter gallaeciensis]ATE99112.1 Transcriptional regulator [Phaeobacter gallaeciensis]ATF03505.1 Transcriptional regulator [Phaeobacter gallaeciensis]ATF07885.1 Transcriptional regulator [Phaeobacter gallaeciensis]
MTSQSRIRSLINRLARIDAAGGWSGSLNPAQYAALDYLGRANRYSRAPSHVAEFLGTTRGTMSQTLKALARKGFVQEQPKTGDQRSISYGLTAEGLALAEAPSVIGAALSELEDQVAEALESALAATLRTALDARGGRAFGLCKTCQFHDTGPAHGYCTLLNLPLQPGDRDLICVEHKALSDDAT